MGPGREQDDHDALFERAPWRLRFADPDRELDFRQWHADRAARFVQAGMLTALAGGGAILLSGEALGAAFARTFRAAVAIATTAFVVAIAVARNPRALHLQQPTTAVAAAVWGCTVVWATHHALEAPELGTTVVPLVSMFGFTVFRLSPALGGAAVVTFAALHQVLIATSDVPLAGGGALHSVLTWVLIVGALVMSVVQDRDERIQYEQEQVIASQHEVIRRERERADDLLRNILPAAIADRLKADEGVIADYYDGVTVLFADVVGFTPLSMHLPAGEVVELLDAVFQCLDDLVDRHGVEKIKTVGDAYMAVAGVPQPRDDHVEAIADLALDILVALDELSRTLPQPIEVRIGIATGDAVAGVIGRRKFAYDLWSDTVNTAARMESHGLPSRIQVTQATAERLQAAYHLTDRGVIDVKGKGPTPTWLLDGRRAGAPDAAEPVGDAPAAPV